MAFNNFPYNHEGITFDVYYKKNKEDEPVIERIMLGKHDVTDEIQETDVFSFIDDTLTEKFQNNDL
jgi:hypothetical protein